MVRRFSIDYFFTSLKSWHNSEYFVSIGLDEEVASDLHLKYYTQYGLALAGLVKHHHVDPLDFDRKCDGSLPLEDMIPPNPAIRKLFEDIDRSKARVYGLTNANKPVRSSFTGTLNNLFSLIIAC
jgi:FMN phosphatase YigB (HAD superfamily)